MFWRQPRLWALLATASFVGLLLGIAYIGLASAQQDPVAKGRYIFQLSGCADCHGANLAGYKEGNPPAPPGSLPFGQQFDLGPLGKVNARNITSDKDTGIGNWSDSQILNAVRRGQGADGKPLIPVMPYATYSGMSDEDARNLVAFLRTAPAVNNKVPANQLSVPPGFQFPSPQLYTAPANAPASPPTARGAYLVRNLGACTDCHSPRGADGLPDNSRYLQGGVIEGFPAPNLTPSNREGVGGWTEQQIATTLKTGQRPSGGRPLVGPMAGVVGQPGQSGLSNLTDQDALAIAAFLKSGPTAFDPASGPRSGSPALGADPMLVGLLLVAVGWIARRRWRLKRQPSDA